MTQQPTAAPDHELLLQREASWITGLILAGMAYGALLTLGSMCLKAFHQSRLEAKLRPGTLSVKTVWQDRILQAHVLLLLLLNTLLQTWNIPTAIKGIVYKHPGGFSRFDRVWPSMLVIMIFVLCDGLLIWRCYMVQRALFARRPAGLHNICWILPLILWLSLIGTGSAVLLKLDPHTPGWNTTHFAGVKLVDATITIDVILSLFTTTNIIIRLLLYRRKMIAAFGRLSNHARYPLRVSTIMLESAAIDVPVTLTVNLGFFLGWTYTGIFITFMVPAQSIASVLVIYEVVKGRAISAAALADDSSSESIP